MKPAYGEAATALKEAGNAGILAAVDATSPPPNMATAISTLSVINVTRSLLSPNSRKRKLNSTYKLEPDSTTLSVSDMILAFNSSEGTNQNTFKMEPDKVVLETDLNRLVKGILKEEIGEQTYQQKKCAQMALDLSSKIKNKVKTLNLPRYKVVCQVIVSEFKNQGFEAASRSIWTPKTDNYTTLTYANRSIFAVAMVHSIFME